MRIQAALFHSFIASDPAARPGIRVLQAIGHCSWGLPQQVLGFLLGVCFSIRGTIERSDFFKGVLFVETRSFGAGYGISLGNIVIHGPDSPGSLKQHEFGHCIQSRMLGPLYLLLIGIPSLTWATARQLGFFRNVDYDALFIERSATRLGWKYGDGI